MADLRPRFPDLFPPNRPYFGNACIILATREPVTCAEVRKLSIAELAWKVREMVKEQTGKEACERQVKWIGREDPVEKAMRSSEPTQYLDNRTR